MSNLENFLSEVEYSYLEIIRTASTTTVDEKILLKIIAKLEEEIESLCGCINAYDKEVGCI